MHLFLCIRSTFAVGLLFVHSFLVSGFCLGNPLLGNDFNLPTILSTGWLKKKYQRSLIGTYIKAEGLFFGHFRFCPSQGLSWRLRMFTMVKPTISSRPDTRLPTSNTNLRETTTGVSRTSCQRNFDPQLLILSGKWSLIPVWSPKDLYMVRKHLRKSWMCYFPRGYTFLEGLISRHGWNIHHFDGMYQQNRRLSSCHEHPKEDIQCHPEWKQFILPRLFRDVCA